MSSSGKYIEVCGAVFLNYMLKSGTFVSNAMINESVLM